MFAADPSDPNNLDENDNGVPYENDDTDNGSYVPPADDDDSSPPADEPDDSSPSADEPDDVQYGPDDAQYETAPPTTTVLPETGGGPISVLALGSLALFVGAGIMAFGLIRRS